MGEILGTALEMWDWLMSHLILINLVLSVIIVFFQRRDPKAVWTWLLALYFVPVFGFLFYLLLCQDLHKSKMFRIKEVEDKLNVSASRQHNLKNLNMTPEQSVAGFAECVKAAGEHGIAISGSISMPFGSPGTAASPWPTWSPSSRPI